MDYMSSALFYAYVYIIPLLILRQDNDTTPISGYHAENWISFCMMMLSIKDACVTLRLTFLGGTDSIYRTRVCPTNHRMNLFAI